MRHVVCIKHFAYVIPRRIGDDHCTITLSWLLFKWTLIYILAYWHTYMKRDLHGCFVSNEPKRRRRYLDRVWRIYTTTISQHNMFYKTTFLLHICHCDICIDCSSSELSYFVLSLGLLIPAYIHCLPLRYLHWLLFFWIQLFCHLSWVLFID